MLRIITFISLVWINIATQEQEFVVNDEFNTGMYGEMFMIQAANKEIQINSFRFVFNGGGSTAYQYGVWYKEGSFVADRLNPTAWIQACSGSVTASDQRLYDPVKGWMGSKTGDCPILIEAGKRYSIYIAGLTRGIVAKKICLNSNCEATYSFDDPIESDAHLTAYMGLALSGPNTFGNGYGDDFFIEPDVSIYYSVDATPAPTAQPTIAMCCVSRQSDPALWDIICADMDERKTCNALYNKKGKQKCRYQECTLSVEEEKIMYHEMVLMNNMNTRFDTNEHYWTIYAILATVAVVLVIFMYRACIKSKGLDGTSPLLANNSV